MVKYYRSSIIICIIGIFLISFCFVTLPAPVKAEDSAFKNIFKDTLFGLGTGAVLAATLTLASSDAHHDDWTRNLGIGGAIGAFLGATYGLAYETKSMITYDGKNLSYTIPLPQIAQNLDARNQPSLYFDLLKWKF